MSYSKAGKIKDFAPSHSVPKSWQVALHTVMVTLCFAFVGAVIFGLVP